MLRGNHESRQMSSHFSFKSECLTKFDEEVYELIMDAFECLPIAAIVDDRIFAVHGGISPELVKQGLDCIKSIYRNVDVHEDS